MDSIMNALQNKTICIQNAHVLTRVTRRLRTRQFLNDLHSKLNEFSPGERIRASICTQFQYTHR